jgi:hypothetical protein
VSEVPALCSDASRAAGEALLGSAVHATRWLLVEVPGPWARDVSDAAGLPDGARDAVTAWLERSAPARLMYVRRPARTAAGRLAFAVHADEASGGVRRFELDRLDDLALVDLDSGGEVVETQLALVCGHGSRDRCCALRGTAVFAALETGLPDEALWISSHQGGHRFAGNVLVLPSGIQLGRLDPDDVVAATARALDGRIELDRYRGRTCFPPPVQAAEHALRSELGLEGLDELRLVGVRDATVRFRDADGVEHAVLVEEVHGPAVPASCGAEPEQQRAFSVRVT